MTSLFKNYKNLSHSKFGFENLALASPIFIILLLKIFCWIYKSNLHLRSHQKWNFLKKIIQDLSKISLFVVESCILFKRVYEDFSSPSFLCKILVEKICVFQKIFSNFLYENWTHSWWDLKWRLLLKKRRCLILGGGGIKITRCSN